MNDRDGYFDPETGQWVALLEPFGDRFESTDVSELDDGGLRWRRRSFAEVTPRAVHWLVPGVVPLGTSTLIAGQGGLGTSTWLMAVAAQVTTGKLNGGQPAHVIVVSYEDTIEEILRPRAEAAGADLTLMHEIVVPPNWAEPCCCRATSSDSTSRFMKPALA